jgi:hypothetical protein
MHMRPVTRANNGSCVLPLENRLSVSAVMVKTYNG